MFTGEGEENNIETRNMIDAAKETTERASSASSIKFAHHPETVQNYVDASVV